MSTASPPPDLSGALFGKTRQAVLAVLFTHPDEAFYLRQLARGAGTGLGAVQREVQRLAAAGILRRTVRDRHVYYQANPQCPLFAELRSLVVKTAGLVDVLRAALAPLADRIAVACVYGSLARGTARRDSDVDLLVVGAVPFADVVTALTSAQETLGREINPTVYPPAEFRAKLAARHHFLTSVLKAPKVYVLGDERELARLAGQRLAG